MSCLTANMYMLSERGVGSLIPKDRQTEGRVIEENFSQDPGLMSRVWPRSAYQRVVSSSFMQRRFPRIVERTQYGFELQVCLLLAMQPWVSHIISLSIGFSTSKMRVIILNQVLLPRSLWRSQLRTVTTEDSINFGTVYLVGFLEPSWNGFLSIYSWLEQKFSV